MQQNFTLLQQDLESYLNNQQIALIESAYIFANKAHSGQIRRTGEPYITHPLAVALLLAQMRMDETTIMAAILHDVLEDTDTSKQQLAEYFSPEVAELVEGVTKLAKIRFSSHAQAQAENFRKLLLAMNRDIRVILVKLADRLHNMRTLASLPLSKKRRISRETIEIFAPIANRLGMHTFNVELEDLGFASLYPERYRVLKEAMNIAHGNRHQMMTMIEQEIRDRLKQHTIPYWLLVGRKKHLYSIYKKMQNKHLSFAEIMDVYGFRVVVDNIDNCYRVLGILHNLYKPIHTRFKDYIAIPKANGYQSLHTTLFGPYGVPLEVQIRTEAMHLLAENGIASHWIYKTQKDTTEKQSFNAAQLHARQWLDGILEIEKSIKNPLEFIENIKIDLFPDKVYVFTPQGEILELAKGATPIDFAYAIHSDIGNRTIAIKLDKQLAPLSTTLKSGQQIEIITAPDAKPNPKWLDFVVTGRAKTSIKQFLKKQQREEAISLGKQLINQTLQAMGGDLDALDPIKVNKILSSLKLKNMQQLFAEVGLGNRSSHLVAGQLITDHQDQQNMPHSPDNSRLAIKGTEGLIISYARCCRPIPGDIITGLLIPGTGLEIHEESCYFS